MAEIPFSYGEDLSAIELPPVPEQEGCYGVWPEFDTSGVSSDLTLVDSEEQAGKLALALAEGQFTNPWRGSTGTTF